MEELPVYKDCATAPTRIPGNRPVRLIEPKHPLAPRGCVAYFKYGEEYYPEQTVPECYSSVHPTSTSGDVNCRCVTNFLIYNKRGERLLPLDSLEQPRHGGLVMYGALLPQGQSAPGGQLPPGQATGEYSQGQGGPYPQSQGGPYPTSQGQGHYGQTQAHYAEAQGHYAQALAQGHYDQSEYGQSQSQYGTSGYGASGYGGSGYGASGYGIRQEQGAAAYPSQSHISSASAVALAAAESRPRKRRGAIGSLKERCDREGLPGPYPVRAELESLWIDYGVDPMQPASFWLVSKQDVYYHLEVPANRYAAVCEPALIKYHLTARVIKTLQLNPNADFNAFLQELNWEQAQAWASGPWSGPWPGSSANISSCSSLWPSTAWREEAPPADLSEKSLLLHCDYIEQQLRLFCKHHRLLELLDSPFMTVFRLTSTTYKSALTQPLLVCAGMPLAYAVPGYPVEDTTSASTNSVEDEDEEHTTKLF
ncbi:cytosine specific DNA methyltransferase replication foci domain protein [Gregarina niphandrodes]|uniref:Cytosine specific DNA methyltransferase replication foci domain protein n=1 Tax=Gregarina niphandrodes TaxID=110365 RepID=A0A023AY03_GRENI|nr:cytosine specific DNA methyltransferase replication foci domain protein [Gregarina niphandrodes]EZG43333.1 cytosine specific DNA methyltransferase replication foci domain protein [Gregarina niphandrodes]|eukprot:XP_011133404.1 cytosine specific DNA methyltransferase replication foci domain protein [Gregarina niphandrodes]